MIGGRGVPGEFDSNELDEDLMNSSSVTNGATLDSGSSDTSATTATMPHDLMELETDTVLTTTALKQQSSSIKQNGSSKLMSIAHTYNYTGK